MPLFIDKYYTSFVAVSGTFYYKIVDLFFVRVVLLNLPNPPGYGPAVHHLLCSVFCFRYPTRDLQERQDLL